MEIRSIIRNERPELVDIGGRHILHILDSIQLRDIDHLSIDAIVVSNDTITSEIRAREDLYLLPLFIESDDSAGVDGKFDPLNPKAILSKIEQIKAGLESSTGLDLPSDNLLRGRTKLLRYLISRKIGLRPIRSRNAKISYDYQLYAQLSQEKDQLHMMRQLDTMVKEGLLKSRPIDKINLCHTCEGNYLNFSECCSKCSSIDLEIQNLIHHFRCAYIGPETDFKSEGGLHCPKCDKHLKHIGIDYDKPSEINTCRQCDHSTQETTVKANCVDCGSVNSLDQLTTHVINSYEVTDKGVELAFKSASQQKPQDEQSSAPDGFIASSVFNLLLNHELQKTDMYSNDIWTLDIEVSQTVLQNLNNDLQESLLQELASIIKPYLGSNDFLSISGTSTIQLALIDYKQRAAESMTETLNYNLDKMLRDNSHGKGEVIKLDLHLMNHE